MRPRGLPRPGVRLLVLALVVVLAVPILLRAERVRLEVGGGSATVRTYAATVGDLLERRGVTLAAADEVRPGPSTPVGSTDRVEVVRSVDFTVARPDGQVRRHSAAVETVGEALEAAGTSVPAGAEVTPPRSDRVREDTRIRVRRPRRVRLVRGGEARTLTTTASTVGAALKSAGIRLGPLETAVPDVDTRLDRADNGIRLRRASFHTLTRTVAIEPPERRRGTERLVEGRVEVVREGEPGTRRVVYRRTYVGGSLSHRSLVSRTVVEEPTPRILEVGTREAPSPGADGVWYRLAHCETRGRWHLDALYDGGLQFDPDTWRNNRPPGYPDHAHEASPEQQIRVGRIVQRRYGWEPWNRCAEQLGLL